MVRKLELLGGRQLVIGEAHELPKEAGAVVWDAALVLAYYLNSYGSYTAGKRVIELGCGPAAAGIAAAASAQPPAAVTLTDLPHLLPLVQQNIEANGVGHLATAAPLAWGTPLSISEDPCLCPPFDVVLASDVLYQVEALPLFVSTLRELSGHHTLTLLCNKHRPALPFPWLLFRQAGFDVRQVPLSEQHPDWRSEDIHLFHIRLAGSNCGSNSSSAAVE